MENWTLQIPLYCWRWLNLRRVFLVFVPSTKINVERLNKLICAFFSRWDEKKIPSEITPPLCQSNYSLSRPSFTSMKKLCGKQQCVVPQSVRLREAVTPRINTLHTLIQNPMIICVSGLKNFNQFISKLPKNDNLLNRNTL